MTDTKNTSGRRATGSEPNYDTKLPIFQNTIVKKQQQKHADKKSWKKTRKKATKSKKAADVRSGQIKHGCK